ncbi:hypothetical protein, partial [Mycobacterium sp.]|uniref:hypothetical protein n=1 Tax=Mycobacterium sp. TaxID=1785 RepID=UPI0025FE7DF2
MEIKGKAHALSEMLSESLDFEPSLGSTSPRSARQIHAKTVSPALTRSATLLNLAAHAGPRLLHDGGRVSTASAILRLVGVKPTRRGYASMFRRYSTFGVAMIGAGLAVSASFVPPPVSV